MGLAIVAVIALSALGCWREAEPPLLLLVSVDTLRADRLGAYGGPAGLTPNLDRVADAGFDAGYLAAADDEGRDVAIRASSAEAFSRTGDGVGTPILTFHPGTEREASFFGPVISKAPQGEEALRLWDAVETLATMSGLAELKRSNRHRLDFT